eukprot:5035104-Amphidinium_carterae.1
MTCGTTIMTSIRTPNTDKEAQPNVNKRGACFVPSSSTETKGSCKTMIFRMCCKFARMALYSRMECERSTQGNTIDAQPQSSAIVPSHFKTNLNVPPCSSIFRCSLACRSTNVRTQLVVEVHQAPHNHTQQKDAQKISHPEPLHR